MGAHEQTIVKLARIIVVLVLLVILLLFMLAMKYRDGYNGAFVKQEDQAWCGVDYSSSYLDHPENSEANRVFKSMCASCHKLDKKMTGPSLIGFLDRGYAEDKEAWWKKFFLDPQALIDAEDPYYISLKEEWGNSPWHHDNSGITEEDLEVIFEAFGRK